MRYFVTGGAGFIGSHLVDCLVEKGGVTVYDNLSSGQKEFIEHHFDRSGFKFIKADLLHFDTLSRAIKGHDVVFHMAANPEVKTPLKDTGLDLKQGTLATYNVLEAMRMNGVKKVIFASSSTVYGEVPIELLSEDYGPLLPISLYGASKLAGEGLITAFCHLFNMQAWIFRLANVVGSRVTHGAVLDFIHKLEQNPRELEILGDGKQAKPYLLIEDCISGILFGFQHSTEQVNVFNLGCSSTTSVSTIAQMLVEEMTLPQVKFKYTGGQRGWPGDVPQVRLNTLKMEKLGWKPKHTSDKAVRKAIRNILSGR
ncbi:NAD-dependent epimerase/dehydratase family protein [Chloroflexota bacterium]